MAITHWLLEDSKGMKTPTLEYYVAKHFNPRINLIVPNVSWGLFFGNEADLLIVSHSGYVTEVELKISKSDIKKDLTKSSKAHNSKLVKYFYYAVPYFLKDCEHLPLDCGLLAVDGIGRVHTIRPPRLNKDARKLNSEELFTIQRLGCMRIWSLKQHIFDLKKRKNIR
jgi:hypothetical protein